MSGWLDGGSASAAGGQAVDVRIEAPAWPAPERDGGI